MKKLYEFWSREHHETVEEARSVKHSHIIAIEADVPYAEIFKLANFMTNTVINYHSHNIIQVAEVSREVHEDMCIVVFDVNRFPSLEHALKAGGGTESFSLNTESFTLSAKGERESYILMEGCFMLETGQLGDLEVFINSINQLLHDPAEGKGVKLQAHIKNINGQYIPLSLAEHNGESPWSEGN